MIRKPLALVASLALLATAAGCTPRATFGSGSSALRSGFAHDNGVHPSTSERPSHNDRVAVERGERLTGRDGNWRTYNR